MASGWRHKSKSSALDPWGPPSPPPLLDEAAPKASKRSHFSRRSTRAKSQAQQHVVELEVEEFAEQRDRDKRRSLLASMFGDRTLSRASRSSSDAVEAPQTLVQREKGFRLVRHGSDPLLNDSFYSTQVQVGNFVKMGWLTKQGHMWKSWKTRFFVLFSDGTFAYYKNKGRKKIKGCMQLNDGVVSVQHVDIRVADKAYVFQIEKGFYKLLCYCCSQFEAELWVTALRSVRRVAPPSYEMDLTATEEKAGSNAVTRHLNKIFITDKQVAKSLVEFKEYEHDHSYAAIHNFIVELDDAIIDRHHLEFYQDLEIELLPGNDLVRLIRRHVEDRVFIPLYAEAYASLETDKVKSRRSSLEKNVKVLKQKTQADFGISKDLSVCNWIQAISAINLLDCVSLPTHKFEVILSAGKAITEAIAQYNGELFEVTDEALTAVFRYVVTLSSLSDLSILRALLKYGYQHHPACQNKANVVTAFLDAIKWVECFETGDESYQFDSMALAGSRVSVSISTNDVGIQFTTDGNGRGAIVYSVRKLSQAALSAAIVPGLSLIAINHEPVIGMPFDKIIQRVRTAALPKQLTFMTEFYYYQLLSLDSEMFHYLMCIAARRGDLDSAGWLRSSTMELNTLCSWEKSRGKQVYGFVPVSGKGSPLHAAVHNGQLGMVNYLIMKGADANLCNLKGRRPLHVVKQSIDMALIIQSLIDAGADIDATEKHGLTPLMFMCSRTSLEGSATLLALGADVHRVAWSNGFSALEFAVKSERTELVELCLSKGAKPNAPTLDGNTSLHLAAALAHADIILRLVQSGANPNVQNRYGQTPATVLLASAPGGNGDARILCLEILTCAGCRLDKRDLFGRQASHLANISCDSHVVGLLRKLGSLNRGGNGVDVDIFGCSSVDYTHRIEINKAARYLGTQMPNNSWKIVNKFNHASRSARPGSIDDLVREIVSGMEVDLVDVVAFVLFLDNFSSLNEVVDRLSGHVRNGIKSHGLIRLFIMILLFKQSETKEADDLRDRFYSLISLNIDVSKDKLVPLVEEYTSLYREYFSLRGAGNYAVNYKTIPGMMIKIYGSDSGVKPLSNEPFPMHLHRYIDAEQWAEQCTLLTHAVFCKVPVQDFISIGSKKKLSVEFNSIKRWFQHISAYVINAVLVQDTCEERAEVISFYLKAADYCMSLHNHDTLASILYALQSTAVQRLRKTIDCLSVHAKKKMNEMQLLSDKGCREMNRLMRQTANPSMPYIGLYLQGFVGLNELPAFDKEGLVNANRLRRMGELSMEILHRQSVAYTLQNDADVDKLLHVSLPYSCEESRYARSLELEPREADALPLSDRGSCVVVDDDLDLESEVRESIGGDGTFGFRQWIRKQQVVHRNRSRSSVIALYEWV
ncbi:Ankyrin repeat and death domain-containing protein 1B [Phytophthora pseudosyringae]|uniref:Ankyrin repeat and death domain-containing protein 1B n=1 Tax=Phytophthora pseudosyringae TaxID=221518 RepID=A0A8T1WK29_9STRA|nr:Ankyrin repeat and death domain-containing protein 1B [Phytophthora pseudosyringae]